MNEKEKEKAKKRVSAFLWLATAHLMAIMLILSIMGNGNLPTAICIILLLAMVGWDIAALIEYIECAR